MLAEVTEVVQHKGPFAPAWLVVPLCALAMLATAAHVLAIQRASMPASRRRIRTVTGLVMLTAAPLLGVALCGVDMSDRRRFLLLWTAVMGLLVMAIALACLDVVNNLRLAVIEKRQIEREAREELARRMKEGA